MKPCTVPPQGWRCTRGAGHPGPCAAVPDVTPAALEVGDVMRWSAELVEALRLEGDRDVLVRVKAIDRHPDGTVALLLENADAQPGWKAGN